MTDTTTLEAADEAVKAARLMAVIFSSKPRDKAVTDVNALHRAVEKHCAERIRAITEHPAACDELRNAGKALSDLIDPDVPTYTVDGLPYPGLDAVLAALADSLGGAVTIAEEVAFEDRGADVWHATNVARGGVPLFWCPAGGGELKTRAEVAAAYGLLTDAPETTR